MKIQSTPNRYQKLSTKTFELERLQLRLERKFESHHLVNLKNGLENKLQANASDKKHPHIVRG